MKWLFFILLALNIAFGAYLYLRESAPSPDGALLRQQLNADKVRVVPPREKPAPRPEPAASVRPERVACIEWGSFAGGELARAHAALDRAALAARARPVEVSVTASWWVYMPPQKTKADMDRKVSELQGMGVGEHYPVLDAGRWRYAISLGIFRSEEGAKNYLATLRGKGVRSAVVGSREQRVSQTVFQFREPSEQDSAALTDLRSAFPGSELRAIDCPAT
jgi:cell division septation protein DedD